MVAFITCVIALISFATGVYIGWDLHESYGKEMDHG